MDTTFWFELGGVVAGIGAGAISAVVFEALLVVVLASVVVLA